MAKPDYPQDLNLQVFLMVSPFISSYNNSEANNPLMKPGVKISYERAFKQWLKLYRFIADRGLVYLLPNDGWFQDIVYSANAGLVLHHLKEPTFIASNFTSPPRRGEEVVSKSFFNQMKYAIHPCPYKWEGEADCKWHYGNVYSAGYGIRSDIRAYKWMSDMFDCHIVPVEMTDKKLYHYDTIMFPIDNENSIVNTTALFNDDVKRLEKITNIIDVPKELKYTGITNLARIGDNILCRDLEQPGKNWLNKICASYGYQPVYFPLEEFDSNGSDLSCMVLHMNKPFRSVGKSVVAGLQQFFRSN